MDEGGDESVAMPGSRLDLRWSTLNEIASFHAQQRTRRSFQFDQGHRVSQLRCGELVL
jgi:hypothetical protein